jgi:uncharacterized LabA/DUF88 family protein
MKSDSAICRLGVFYDGSYFAFAQRYFFHEKKLGWLRFQPFHLLLEQYISHLEQGHAAYRVVYSAWFQGMFPATDATEDKLRFDRNHYHDLMHAGIEAKYLPMSQAHGEKGIDVALAVDALQVGLNGTVDVAVLVTGDGDFVPLARTLMKNGVRVLVAYFDFVQKDGGKSFINDRLLNAANYALNVNELEGSKDYKGQFRGLFRKQGE